MDFTPDYKIIIDQCNGQPGPGKLTIAAGEIINQLIALDRVLLSDLDRSLSPNWVSSGSTLGIKICFAKIDLNETDKNNIIRHLCQCKKIILESIATFSGADDYNDLVKKLTSMTNSIGQKYHNSLIPSHKINKLGLAKIMVKFSQIGALRLHEPKYIYEDSTGQIMLRCDKILEKNDLLGEKNQDSGCHEARFGIRYTPTDGQGNFTLTLDGKNIKHRIEDTEFLGRWDTGQEAVRCHDVLHAKFSLLQQPDPQDNIYRITTVIDIVHVGEMSQKNLPLKEGD